MATQEIQHAGHVAQNASSKPPPNDNDTYRMMVLRLDQSEEEVDEQLLQTALDLGIEIPQPPSPKSTIDPVTDDVATLDIRTATPEPSVTPEPSIQSSSQASGSVNAQSDSSIEYRRHVKTPSLTATSITSIASIGSVASQKSNYAKVKKGFRRISMLRRRKISVPALPIPLPPAHPIRPALPPRAATADQVSSTTDLQPHALTTDEPDVATTRRPQVISASYLPITHNGQPSCPLPPTHPSASHQEPNPTPESPEIHDDRDSVPSPSPPPVNLEAQERSLKHPTLKKLRTTQLQEQLRFISFQASQSRLLRTTHLEAKRAALTAYKARQFHLETAHADSLVSLEHRHLSAEVDLRKGLEADRKGCDVKLKHMQAYCNPKSAVAGMPRREVTKADYRQLEQQYHIRNGMDNLHASKINVLREKQAKQLERIVAKQEAELEQAETDFEQENADLEQRFRDGARCLREDFSQRRDRLVRRWDLAEAIERRKLELDTGEEWGKLPDVEWGEGEVAERKNGVGGSSTAAAAGGTTAAAAAAGKEPDTDIFAKLDGLEGPRYDVMNII